MYQQLFHHNKPSVLLVDNQIDKSFFDTDLSNYYKTSNVIHIKQIESYYNIADILTNYINSVSSLIFVIPYSSGLSLCFDDIVKKCRDSVVVVTFDTTQNIHPFITTHVQYVVLNDYHPNSLSYTIYSGNDTVYTLLIEQYK